jgi:hypothetical protein
MAENVQRLRAAPGDLIARVGLHIMGIEEAAEIALEQAQQRAENEFGGAGGGPLAGSPATPKSTLTPPSSNTGGKVPRTPKKGRGH